jgi:hypothetical protein
LSSSWKMEIIELHSVFYGQQQDIRNPMLRLGPGLREPGYCTEASMHIHYCRKININARENNQLAE